MKQNHHHRCDENRHHPIRGFRHPGFLMAVQHIFMEGHQQRGDCQVGHPDGLRQNSFGNIGQHYDAQAGGQGDVDAGGVEELFEFGHGGYYGVTVDLLSCRVQILKHYLACHL